MREWKPIEGEDPDWIVEILTDGGWNEQVAAIETFTSDPRTFYPRSLNPTTNHWERGGPMSALRSAMEWCERVSSGQAIPGDERPPFYFECERECRWRVCFFKGCDH